MCAVCFVGRRNNDPLYDSFPVPTRIEHGPCTTYIGIKCLSGYRKCIFNDRFRRKVYDRVDVVVRKHLLHFCRIAHRPLHKTCMGKYTVFLFPQRTHAGFYIKNRYGSPPGKKLMG